MKISSNPPSFGASFVDNKAFRKIVDKSKINAETKTLAKKITSLPQKDKLEILDYEYSGGSIFAENLDVSIKNLTTGETKVFHSVGDYNINIFNDLLEKILKDATEEKSNFWAKKNYQEIIDILIGKE